MDRLKRLREEWSNKNLKQFSEYTSSEYNAWWEHICECGEKHEWKSTFKNRTQGNNCPICSGKGAQICYCKSVEKLRPDLAKEWSPENGERKSGQFSINSGYMAIWEHTCDCGEKHKWKAAVSQRNKGTNCPLCSGKGRVPPCKCKTFGSLYPNLLKEWSEENEKDPFRLSPQSSYKTIWKHICECGKVHTWITTLQKRTSRRDGCPKCSGKGRVPPCLCKSFGKLRHDLALEWHPDKNEKTPFEYTEKADTKVWWKCLEKGHEWEAKIIERATRSYNCPFCKISRGERFLKKLLDRKGIEYISQKRLDNEEYRRYSFDFYLPKHDLAIEFDGKQHFEPTQYFGGEEEFENIKRRDKAKNLFCEKKGISLFRIHYLDINEIEDLLEFAIGKFNFTFLLLSSHYP